MNKTSAKVSTVKKIVRKNVGRITVDIVTGKELISVFFDPSKSIDINHLDEEWMRENLFAPACVLREDTDGNLSLKLTNGEVVRMPGCDAIKICEQDDEGLSDILRLREFSEMSLVHTLRTRYARDEIYTFVGPIVISINPYKRISGLYDDCVMLEYHGQKQANTSFRHG